MPAPNRSTDFFTDFQLKDYVAIARHRKWWMIVTAALIGIPAIIVGYRLPNVYKANTIIMVDAQKVPDAYVPSTVNSRVEERLSAIQQQVTSASRLSKLIDSMNLYRDLRGRLTESEVIKNMQKNIAVENVARGGRQLTAFRISFQGKNAVEVSQVTNQLATMFIEENLKVREQQSYGTADFITNELQKTKTALEQKENELKHIKTKYMGDLPESAQFHMQALENLRSQLRESQDRVNRAQQQKVYLQTMNTAVAPTVDLDVVASPYQAPIQKLESELAELRARYGPGYPDVRKLQAKMDELKAKEAEEEKRNPPSPVAPKPKPAAIRNPIAESELARIDEEIAREQQNQSALQGQVRFHLSKLEHVPVFEQQMTSQMRDYETLRKYYTGLLDKKLAADTATALESRQKGERFMILDPAQVPDKPFSPNRLFIVLGALLGSVLAAISVAALREISDSSVRNELEAVRILGQGVLVRIPQIRTPREIRRSRFQAVTGVAATLLASVVLGFGLSIIAARML